MRILYHHRTLADGAEGVHIAAMVDAFRELGHDVTMLGMSPWRGPEQAVTPDWRVRLKAAIPGALFELVSVAMNFPEFLRTLLAVRRQRPHFAYKRHARYDLGPLLALRWCGVPVVLEVNCLFTQPPYVTFEPHAFRHLARRFEMHALQLASTVLTVSSPLAQQVSSLSNTPVHVVPNGVDVIRFHPDSARPDSVRARWGLQERLVVGWVGVIRAWHGLELLLEALQSVEGVTLLVVGDGPGRGQLESRAQAIGLANRVVVTGRVPHQQMPDYVAAMDVAVVADERTGVASPMKLLEYLAMGRAVVAPRIPNIEDVVRDRDNGLLFAPGNAGDLMRCLKELLHDPTTRRMLGERAKQDVVRERTWRRVAERVVALVS